MSGIPNFISIELEEKDVGKNVLEVLSSMSMIRNEKLKVREISEEGRDEYLHLTQRLASGIEALSDGFMVENLKAVVEELNSNMKLLDYDPFQDEYWKKNNPRAMEGLENILISLVKEDFNTLDTKHHIMQAIKYLGAAGEKDSERERIYGTIFPFGRGIPFDSNNGIGRKIAAIFFGESFDVRSNDGLTLEIEGNPYNSLDDLKREAKERGYSYIRFFTGSKAGSELEKMVKDNPGSEISYTENTKKHNEKIRKIVADTVKHTKYLSLPLIGLLPLSLKKRLYHYIKAGSPSDIHFRLFDSISNIHSLIPEMIAGLGIAYAVGQATNDSFGFIIGGLLGAKAILRGIISSGNTDVYPPLEAKIALLPLENYLNERDNFSKGHRIRMPVQDINVKDGGQNAMSYYEKIAKLDAQEGYKDYFFSYLRRFVDEKIEFDPESYKHNLHNYFPNFVNRNVELPKNLVSRLLLLDGRKDLVTYESNVEIGDYNKGISLFYFVNGSRYIVTSIRKKHSFINFDEYIGPISGIIERDDPLVEKAGNIGKVLGSKYIRVMEYRNGSLAGDAEGFDDGKDNNNK